MRIRLPAVGLDFSHRRHFFEAVARHPRVQVVAGQDEADVAFDLTPAGLHVLRDSADPHAHAPGVGSIEPFLDPRMMHMVPLVASAAEVQFIRDRWLHDIAVMNPRPAIAGMDDYDVILVNMRDLSDVVLRPRLARANLLWAPWGVPASIFRPGPHAERLHDVFLIASRFYMYPLRRMMDATLSQEAAAGRLRLRRELPYNREALELWRSDYRLFDLHQQWYAEALRRSRIHAFCPGILGYPVQRYLETMACGALVVAPLPRDSERYGFVDGETMVDCDETDFLAKVHYYLAHEDERRRIADNAADLARERLTCEAVAGMVVGALEGIADGRRTPVDGWYE